MPSELLIDNDNVITVAGVRNGKTDEYLNNAVVKMTVTDMDGRPVSGQTWPFIMDYQAGSNGVYKAVLENTQALKANEYYRVDIEIQGDGLSGRLSQTYRARKRI